MNDTWCELQYYPTTNTIKKILPGDDVRASIARLDETVSQMNDLSIQNNQLLSTPPSSPSDDDSSDDDANELYELLNYHKNWECSKCRGIIINLLIAFNDSSCLDCGRFYDWDCACSGLDYCNCEEPCNSFLYEYNQLEKQRNEVLNKFADRYKQLEEEEEKELDKFRDKMSELNDKLNN